MKTRFVGIAGLAATLVCFNFTPAHAQTIGSLVGKNGQLKTTVRHGGDDGSGDHGSEHHGSSIYDNAFAEALKISPIALSQLRGQGLTILHMAEREAMSVATLRSRAESAFSQQLRVEVKEKIISASTEKTELVDFKSNISRLIVRNTGSHDDGENHSDH